MDKILSPLKIAPMENIRQIVDKYITAYNDFDIDQMISLFDEDCFFENISNSVSTIKAQGRQELRELALKSAELFEKRAQTITDATFTEDKAFVKIDYSATFAVDLPNGFKKGQELHLKGESTFEFKDGKIKSLTDLS